MREWLRKLRTENGLTMKEAGELLDITECYYSLIERGERQKKMDITLITKLADVFSISVADVINYEQKGEHERT